MIFIEIPGRRARHRAALRPPRQAAGDDRLGRGVGPWAPVLEDGKLYGRGGADDGYAIFARAVGDPGAEGARRAHARCAILIEACEESGSYDLPAYVDQLAARIGTPSPGGLPRFRLRQLRPALAHHLAARPGRRGAEGRGARRRRALGRRRGRRAVELPHLAQRCRAWRTKRPARSCRPSSRPDPRRRVARGQGGRRRARRELSTPSFRSPPACGR